MSRSDRQHQASIGDEATRKREVLRTIALIIVLMLLIPAVLASLAPSGPVKEGDVVLANGRHEVRLKQPERYQHLGYRGVCFVEPREPLMVLETLLHREDELLLVRVEGRSRLELPFCPPAAQVLLKRHQYGQKVTLWEEFSRLFR